MITMSVHEKNDEIGRNNRNDVAFAAADNRTHTLNGASTYSLMYIGIVEDNLSINRLCRTV